MMYVLAGQAHHAKGRHTFHVFSQLAQCDARARHDSFQNSSGGHPPSKTWCDKQVSSWIPSSRHHEKLNGINTSKIVVHIQKKSASGRCKCHAYLIIPLWQNSLNFSGPSPSPGTTALATTKALYNSQVAMIQARASWCIFTLWIKSWVYLLTFAVNLVFWRPYALFDVRSQNLATFAGTIILP